MKSSINSVIDRTLYEFDIEMKQINLNIEMLQLSIKSDLEKTQAFRNSCFDMKAAQYDNFTLERRDLIEDYERQIWRIHDSIKPIQEQIRSLLDRQDILRSQLSHRYQRNLYYGV